MMLSLRLALAALLFLPMAAQGMRVDPARILARLRLEAEAEASWEMKEAGAGRNRRQLGGSPKEETIQVTAPLFSSRLFEFGPRAGDKEMAGGLDTAKKLPLSRPLSFFGQSHSAVWVLSNGGIGFEQAARQYRANLLPSGQRLIAPFWNRNDLRNGGKIYYREVASGRVLERGQSEIRYQYDLEVKVHTAVLATFEKMQPVGTEALPDENTNTFQLALFTTSNGTFANFIYSNIGWTQGAEAGFNSGDGVNFFALPTSGTGNIMYLEDYGNTGIPGEWMFILSEQRIQRCKSGIKGDTCDEACSPSEWGPDCARCCHCADEKAGCADATGECKKGGCSQCWAGPTCQQSEPRCGGQRQCGQNALQRTDLNRCGEPQQRCECAAGFQGDPYAECIDIDECARPNACHPKAHCTNQPGRFLCQCQSGFQGDGIKECAASFLYPFDQSHRLPNDRHGRVEWQLKHPLRIFGRDRDNLSLTSNGLILAKGAKNVPTKSGERHGPLEGMDVQGVAPFFAPIDLAQQGQIFVEETTDPRILAKAAQLVNEQLGAGEGGQFTASHALLVTYVNVSLASTAAQKGAATAPMNTFQALLLGGRDRLRRDQAPMTFVQLLYRDLQLDGGEEAEAGIMAPDRTNSILLPGSGSDEIAEQLGQRSNVRSPGIWLFRIDDAAPSACILPDLQPPYCDADRSPPLDRPVPSSSTPPPPSPSTTSSSSSTSTIDAQTVPVPPPKSTAPPPSFGLEEEGEGEDVEEGDDSSQQQIRPKLPRIEQTGWTDKEKQQQQTAKKPSIVQIQSREFAEMPPDAFDDGTVSRATTRSPEEEQEEKDADIREIVPSLIVPELVKPAAPAPAPSLEPPAQNVPSKAKEIGQGKARVKETSLEVPAKHQKPQIRIEQQPAPAKTMVAPAKTTTTAQTEEGEEEGRRVVPEDGAEEPMQTIRPEDEEEGREDGATAPAEMPSPTTMAPPAESTITTTKMSQSSTASSASTTDNNNNSNHLFVFNTTTKKQPMSSTTKPKMVVVPVKPATTEVPKQKPENPDGDDPILMDWDQQGNPLMDGAGPPGSKLSIVVPIAIVLVWLVVLVIVAVFLCCRRRQTQERLRTLYGPAYQIRPVYTMRVNKLGGGGEAGSYEEHLEKAAQRLSAEMAYNPNPLWAGPGRYSLYGSYWNISPEGSAAGRNCGHAKQRSTGGGMDIGSPRSQESGGGGQGGATTNYAQQMAANGHRTTAGGGAAAEREATVGHSDFFGQRGTASGQRFSGRH